MTEQEIRDGAPPTATHYRNSFFGTTYFRKTKNGIEMYNWNDWIKTGHTTLDSFKPLP